MSVTTRPMPRPRQRAPGEAGSRRIQWWHYLLAACALAALVGLGYGVRALWFSMTHIRTTYAWVSGVVVSLSAKDDTRVRQLLVRTGDRVRKGDIVAILDNADAEAAVDQARANLRARESALARAEADLELTIRQTSASIEEAEAELAASRARLAQAEADMSMQSRSLPDEVKRSQAALAGARARLAQLEAGARPQEIEQARAELASAESQLARASATLRRMEKLHQQGAVSAQALDTARTDMEVAQAAVAAQKERLSLLQAGSRKEDIEAARQAVAAAEAELALALSKSWEQQMKAQQVATRSAEQRKAAAALKSAQSQQRMVALKEQDVLSQRAAVAEAKAALEAAMARLSDTRLRSTENGIVVGGAGPTVHEGEVVTKGQPIVTVVSTDNPLWISGFVSELYASRVRENQPAVIRIDAFRGRVFRGRLARVGAATDLQSTAESPWALKQVPIKVHFDSGEMAKEIKPGMTCRVWIDVRK